MNAQPQRKPLLVMCLAAATTLLIAWLDRHLHHNVPLSLLYLAPMALVSTVTKRWQVFVAAALCTLAAEYSDAFAWNYTQGLARDLLYFIAYAAEGLYVSEMLAKRRAEKVHVAALTSEVAARREAEEQLNLLVSSSSVAILTADEAGNIVQANEAALRLFNSGEPRLNHLQGSLGTILPALTSVPMLTQPSKSLRTMLQCQGFRVDRQPFVADVWFSTYSTPLGIRMTAVVADVSDDFRSREESSLEQTLHGSRLVVGAMTHEMRNVCAAIGLVSEGLSIRLPDLKHSEDFQALRQLTATLERMTSVELSHVKRDAVPIRLAGVLDDLRIIFTAYADDSQLEISWSDTRNLPVVWADQQGLIQVFLNLLRNAQTALVDSQNPHISVHTVRAASTIEVHVTDNGPGVRTAEHLFRPFEAGSTGSGLGLYLSRAIMNSFRGDLRYEPANPGARFIVELLTAE